MCRCRNTVSKVLNNRKINIEQKQFEKHKSKNTHRSNTNQKLQLGKYTSDNTSRKVQSKYIAKYKTAKCKSENFKRERQFESMQFGKYTTKPKKKERINRQK